MTLKLTKKQIYTFKGTPIDALYENDKDLDTRISALDGAGETELSQLEASTEAKIIVYDADGVAQDVAMSGDTTITAAGAVTIGANKVLAGKAKIATRDLEVAIGAATATVTTAADINGIVLGAHFTAASADATATEITSVRFVSATGALTVTTNANATAATVIRVTILQAA